MSIGGLQLFHAIPCLGGDRYAGIDVLDCRLP
jgi:hypothetical protein